jgi:acyl-CoA thioester hydrolase
VSGPFRHRMRVRFHECDPQGAVFNANFLTYFDIAVTELWREALGGWQQMVSGGIDVVLAEARVRYLAPLRFDEEFDVRVTIPRFGTTSFQTAHAIERDGTVVAEGDLRHVFIGTDGSGKRPIPDEVREALQPYAV